MMAGYAQGNTHGVYGFISSPVYSQPSPQRPCLGSGSIFSTKLVLLLPVDALVTTHGKHNKMANAKHNKNAASSCFACVCLGSKPHAQPSNSVDEDELPACNPSPEKCSATQKEWIQQRSDTAKFLAQCVYDLAASESEPTASVSPRCDKMIEGPASDDDDFFYYNK